MTSGFAGVFRSLRGFNYRVWVVGAFVSNIGTWVQRTAQDWLVLTQLTDHDATAVGLVMALQFGPQLLLLPVDRLRRRPFRSAQAPDRHPGDDGHARPRPGRADRRRDRRALARCVFAFLFGSTAAFDAPVRQTFVAELGRREGPAQRRRPQFHLVQRRADDRPGCRGLLIATLGTGWAFLMNGASFVAVLIALACFARPSFARTPGHGGPEAASPRASATCGAPGPQGDPGHAVS